MVFIQFSTIRSFIILCQRLHIRQSQFRHNDFFCLILISNSSCNSRNHSNHCYFQFQIFHFFYFLNYKIIFSPYLSFQRKDNHIAPSKKITIFAAYLLL